MSETLLHDQVLTLYNKHPYPNYPLFAGIKWADAHYSSAHFSAMLRAHSLGLKWNQDQSKKQTQEKKHILIVGCGDTMPYILRQLEPANHQIYALDLSRHNLNRARLRLWRSFGRITFIESDFIHFARTTPLRFDHIDCYGVLHHTANPLKAIKLMAELLRPYATVRLMVYNTNARQWIHHISRAFSLLGLSIFEPSDIKKAIRILELLCVSNPIMQDRLYASGILKNIHIPRIADTFFHPREARLDLQSYIEALETSNLNIDGLWDRYGELDDLKNPLWTVPSTKSLNDRSLDLRFENNLELFCHKREGIPPQSLTMPAFRPSHYLKLITKQAPRHWFSFDETRQISWQAKHLIWKNHLDSLYKGQDRCISHILKPLSPQTRQRLARVGAILPIQSMSSEIRDQLWQPIHSHMEPLHQDRRQNEISSDLEALIDSVVNEKKKSSKVGELVKKRIKRSGY